MNRIIVAIITIMMLCPLAQAKNRTVTENDSLGNKKRVIELLDTVIDGKSVTDTLSITTYEDSSLDTADDKDERIHNDFGGNWDWNLLASNSETIIAVTAIIFVFGMPLLPIPPCRTGMGKRTTATRRLLPRHQKREGHPHQRHQQCLLRHRTVHLPLGHHRRIRSSLHRTAGHVHRIRTTGHLLHAES